MKKIMILALTIMAVVMFVGSALAVPAGKTVEYPGGAHGKVVFDGKAMLTRALSAATVTQRFSR